MHLGMYPIVGYVLEAFFPPPKLVAINTVKLCLLSHIFGKPFFSSLSLMYNLSLQVMGYTLSHPVSYTI